MLSSAGLMNSFATTRYANSTRGCVTARMIVEITLTKTQTCAVGWNCHSQGFPLKTIDAYFISHYSTSLFSKRKYASVISCNISSKRGFVVCFCERRIHYLFVSFHLQPNFPALLQGRSVAETITCVCAQTKFATRWMIVVTTRMKKSVVSTECAIQNWANVYVKTR